MRFLTVVPRKGLGNRVRALVAAMRAAAATGRRLGVSWAADGYHCHCPLGLLFANPFEPPPYSPGRVERHGVQGGPVFLDPASQADTVWVEEENFFYLAGDEGVMWGQHGPHRMANPSLRAELLSAFAGLVPHPAVRTLADDFAAESLAGRRLIGVHVRRGDSWWCNAFAPTKLFVPAVRDALEKAGGDHSLLVATDDPAAEARLRHHFAGRVLAYPKRTPAQDRGRSALAVQDALVEMLLLSRTELIVRSAASTFSQVAAWMGNVPTVEVGKPEHDW